MLDTLFYGNTLLQWTIALSGSLFAFVLGRAIYWVLSRGAKSLTKRTKTELDDILIDQLEEPIAMVITLWGIRFCLDTLTMTESVEGTLHRIFSLATVFIIAWTITRLYEAFHVNYAVEFTKSTETDLDDYLLPLLRTGVKIIVWCLAIIVGLDNAGYDVGAILAGLGIGGLAFALAAQHAFGDFVGGVNIFIDRHFKVGDRIQITGAPGGTIDGEVLDIGLRTTKIETRYEGRIVNIPNSIIANNPIVNVDSENGRQMFSIYRLAPDTPIATTELALQLLKTIATESEDTQDRIVTSLIEITEVSQNLSLLYWIKPDSSNLGTRKKINLEILRQFEENNIKLTDKTQLGYRKQAMY